MRSESSLIQTVGRAARNDRGRVIMYADVVTGSMRRAIDETNRRRAIQDDYNKRHGIVPKTIVHDVKNTLEITKKEKDIKAEIERLTALMKECASRLDFEKAIELREQVAKLEKRLNALKTKKTGRTG